MLDVQLLDPASTLGMDTVQSCYIRVLSDEDTDCYRVDELSKEAHVPGALNASTISLDSLRTAARPTTRRRAPQADTLRRLLDGASKRRAETAAKPVRGSHSTGGPFTEPKARVAPRTPDTLLNPLSTLQ